MKLISSIQFEIMEIIHLIVTTKCRYKLLKKSEQNKLYFIIFISLMVNSVNVHDILAVMKVVTFLLHLLENVTSKLIHPLLSHSHCLLGEKMLKYLKHTKSSSQIFK